LGLTAFCCFLLIPAPASAYQWNRVATDTTLTANQLCKTDGTNIVCDSTTPTILGNNVGIGTTNPSADLHIYSTSNQNAFTVRANNGNTWSVDPFGDLTSTSGPYIGYDSNIGTVAYSANSGGETYITSSDSFTGGGAKNIYLLPYLGKVGIGTTNPNDKLDVAGAVKIAGTGSEGCTTATMGQMRFNPTYNYMEICQ
jgi:hypothetical protein